MRDSSVLASVEVLVSRRERRRGARSREGLDGALLFRPARAVHTFGVRFPIDVAFCDEEMVVLSVVRVSPRRLAGPKRGCHVVIEAEAGSFERWGLRPGDKLEIEGRDHGGPDHGGTVR